MPATPRARTAEEYWSDFDGIPLCHAPKTAEEAAELAKKGFCGCVG